MVQMSFRGAGMLAPLYSLHLGASTSGISFAVACYSLAPLLLSLRVGRLCDEVGNRGPACVGAALCAAAPALPPLLGTGMADVVLCQLLFGLGHMTFQLSMQNLVGKMSDDSNRSGRFSMLSACMSLGNMASPLIVGPLIDAKGHPFSYAVCAGFAGVATLLAWLFIRPVPPSRPGGPERGPKKGVSAAALLSGKPVQKMLITSATVMTGTTLFAFYLPLYASGVGCSASRVGVLFSVYAAAFLLVRLIFPFLSGRLSPEQTLVCSLIVSGAGYVAVPLTQGFAGLAAACFFIGLGLGCGYPLTMSMAYKSATADRTGAVLGMRLTANRLVQLVLPVATGLVTSSYSPVFVGLGVFLAGSATVYAEDFGNNRKGRRET